MEVINPRSALLSNFEVLELLRELDSDHVARTKTAVRLKKEEEASGLSSSIVPGGRHPSVIEVSENVRTLEVEAIRYLSSPFQRTSMQSADGIFQMVKSMEKYDLTKAEKLQIVNLAPRLPVELYVIVEELEDRLGDKMQDLLDDVERSLSTPAPASQDVAMADGPTSYTASTEYTQVAGTNQLGLWKAEHTEQSYNEIIFDDTGEGVGVEGDLDVEED